MGNVYVITKCNHCKKAVAASEQGTIMAHREANAAEVMGRINAGEDMATIAPEFCGHCGNKLPCGCSEPTPQHA